MAALEHTNLFSSEVGLHAALTNVERKLELADEIENPLERFWIREYLLDLQDTLQSAVDEAASSRTHG